VDSERERRAHGEGSIKQGADGRWHGYVSMGIGAGGKRVRKHVTAASRPAVVKRMKEVEKLRDSGTAAAAGASPKVSAWMKHWLDTIAIRRVRPSTLVRYRQLVDNQIDPHIGHHRLDRLQPEHVEAMYAELGDELAPSTVGQVHRVLSRALKVAVQRGRVGRNVCTLVDAPSIDRDEVEALSADEARKVLARARRGRNAARWSIALALGLRQGEALGLTWDRLDLDADPGVLRVRQALQRQAGVGLVLVVPKSKAGKRDIALPTQLREELKAHRKAQLQERLAAGEKWHDGDLVFCQKDGKAIDPRGDHREWRSLLKEANVRQVRLHDARHTAATLLLEMGVDPRVVQEILGHAQISLTQGTYQHVTEKLAQDAAKAMNQVLWTEKAPKRHRAPRL
jgi:integrase